MDNHEVQQQVEDMLVQESNVQGSLEVIIELAKRAGFSHPKHIQTMTDVCLSLAVWAYLFGVKHCLETQEIARRN